jgi:TolB protein
MKKILLFTLLLFSFVSEAQDKTVVAVGEAELEKNNLLFVSSPGKGLTKESLSITNILKNDFSFYKKKYTGFSGSVANLKKSYFTQKKINYGVEVTLEKNGSSFKAQAKLYDSKMNLSGTFTSSFNNMNKLRANAHVLSNEIYKKLTKTESMFLSKIIFVSDRDGRKANHVKEIYSMDFDGGNPKRETFHKGTVISPALSIDGKKVLYSLIKNNRSKKRNVNLYLLNLETGKSEIISSKKGINSGAVFMPDGKSLLMTMTHQGNAELYAMDIATKRTRRITKHSAPDVDPSINVRGDLMTFLSGRSGTSKPMIYIADPRAMEKGVKRISYVGRFNATPRFSPDGTEIAFSSWLDNKFDIFRVDSTGDNLYRLTKDFGSNEDPTYSKDGQFIAFSSQRVISSSKAVQNIYIMGHEGEIIGQITKNFGNCTTPRWSK